MDDFTAIIPTDKKAPHEKRSRKRRGGWFATDEEIIERSGVPEKIMRDYIHMQDRNPHSTFPKKVKELGDRRLIEAVQDYFRQHFGLKMSLHNTGRLNRG